MKKKDLQNFLAEFVYGEKTEIPDDFVFFERCYKQFVNEMGYSKQQAEQKDEEFHFSERLIAMEKNLKLLDIDLSNPSTIEKDKLDILVFLGVEQMKLAVAEGGDLEFVFQNQDGILTAYNGSDADVVVPNYISAIGDGVFEDWDFSSDDRYDCTEHHREVTDFKDDGTPRLKSIVLPNTVKVVGDRAFYNCKALEKAELPEVLEIGAGAFHACKNLRQINMPNVCDIGAEAFLDCSNLLLPALQNVEVIGDCAFLFAGVNKKQNLTLPDSLVELGKEAFSRCSLNHLHVPKSVQKIGVRAFADSTVQKAEIFSCEIAESMFQNCHRLTKVILSENVKSIQKKAFADCDSLHEILIPSSVEEIGEEAFGDSGLNSVTFAAGSRLKKIGKNAFLRCQLEEIEIPKNVETIEGLAVSSFKKFSISKDNAFFEAVDGALYKKDHKGNAIFLVSFFDKAATHYKMPDTVTEFDSQAFLGGELAEIVLSKNLKKIPSNAFQYCTNLKKLTIPSGSVVELAESAFYKLTASEIHLPEGITHIPKHAFSLNKLDKLTLPKSLKTIDDGAFAGCKLEGDLIVPKGVETIGEGAFGSFCGDKLFFPKTLKSIGGFTSLSPKCFVSQFVVDASNKHFATLDGVLYQKSTTGQLSRLLKYPSAKEDAVFVMPDSVTQFDERAFLGNDFLTEIVLSKNLETLPSNAFCSCKGLKKIEIPQGIKNLSSFAFNECCAEQLILPNGISDIPVGAFYYAQAKTIVLPSSIKSIGKNAFAFCEAEEINIPEGVVEIPEKAFQYSTARKVTLPSTVKTIGESSFEGCKAETLVLPDNLESIDEFAFAFCENITEIKIPNSVKTLGKRIFLQRYKVEKGFKKIFMPLRFKDTQDIWAGFTKEGIKTEVVYFEAD